MASHIITWSANKEERLNPENGICLSALYDKAFDKGYIGITEKYKIIISRNLKKKQKEEYYSKYFTFLQGSKLILPQKYKPNTHFLQYHLDVVFKG